MTLKKSRKILNVGKAIFTSTKGYSICAYRYELSLNIKVMLLLA
jgi:hypothetical protein